MVREKLVGRDRLQRRNHSLQFRIIAGSFSFLFSRTLLYEHPCVGSSWRIVWPVTNASSAPLLRVVAPSPRAARILSLLEASAVTSRLFMDIPTPAHRICSAVIDKRELSLPHCYTVTHRSTGHRCHLLGQFWTPMESRVHRRAIQQGHPAQSLDETSKHSNRVPRCPCEEPRRT